MTGTDKKQQLMGLLRELLARGGSNGAPGGAGSGTPTDAERAAIDMKLLEMLSRAPGPVQAGRVNLLDMSAFRRRLGDRWLSCADSIRQITRKHVLGSIGPDDIFAQLDGETFLIVFAGLTEARARLKCACLADELEAIIVGSSLEFEGFRISTVTETVSGKVDLENLDKKSVLAQIEMLLCDAAGKAKARAEADTSAAFEWTFRPMWSIRQRMVTTFTCIAVWIDEDGRARYSDAAGSAMAAKFNPAETNLLTLEKAIRVLRAEISSGNRLVLTVPVHLSTLTTPAMQSRYAEACEAIPKSLKRYILFEVLDIPPHADSGWIKKSLRTIAPYAGHAAVRVPITGFTLDRLADTGIGAVGLDLRSYKAPEAEVIAQLQTFVEAAERNGLQSYVIGAQSLSLVVAAVCNGFSFISGEVVQSMVDVPSSAFPFDLRDLYARKLFMQAEAPAKPAGTVKARAS